MAEPFSLTQCKTISTSEFERMKVGDWLMEPKVDGWRMQIDVTPDRCQLWTRTQHDATGKMPWVEQDLMYLTSGTHSFRLDAEAVYMDHETDRPDYNFTQRCLGSGREVCVSKQRDRGHLSIFVFDILALNATDLRDVALATRKDILKDHLSDTGLVNLVLGDEPTYEQHTRNFEQYLEGSVLKQMGSKYAGKRHSSWRKWKEIETLDVRILGYKPGQGKFTGLIGAIQFIGPDGTKGYCSGMDDETRIWISDNRESLIGRVIEIKHFGKLVEGFRHPQFIRFREDK